MSLNLPDEQKRWVVVGICLNKILLPTLRNFLSPQMKTHYANLKAKHNIHKQTHGAHLSEEGKLRSLNYGNINNNEVNHKKESHLYDYNVKSEVELAKLYLLPFMAKFTDFDDTCDVSAVLGILASAGIFSGPIKKCSSDVRKRVRNEWGHCDFTKWDAEKYSKCFELMKSLVRALSLPKRDDKKVKDDLEDWETKGLQLCMGKPVDADLVKLIKVEVNELGKIVKFLEKTQSDEAQRISNGLQSVLEYMKEFKKNTNKRIKIMEESPKTMNKKVDELIEAGKRTQKPDTMNKRIPMVRNIPKSVINAISVRLDVEDPFMNDARKVGGKVGLQPEQIEIIWEGEGGAGKVKPTKNILKIWKKSNKATIPKFREILVEIGRDDVVDILDAEYPQVAAAANVQNITHP